MNFERLHKRVGYGLVAVSFAVIAASGEIGAGFSVAFGIAGLYSYFRTTDGPVRPLTARIWTGVLLASLALLTLWAYQDENWLLHSLEFALLMTLSRLFQRRYAKDYVQLYALSFLLMLVGAVINPSLMFAVSFLLYAILVIWGLTMAHLAREIEVQTRTGPEYLEPDESKPDSVKDDDELPESPIAPETLQWRRRRLIGGGFLVASSLMALAALMVSMLFFFLFPRLGMGFFHAQTRGAQSVTGFSEEVKLGNFGKIKSSAEVVMRVRFPEEPDRLQRPIRLRGISFDQFDGRNWSRVDGPRWHIPRRVGERFEVIESKGLNRGQTRRYLMHVYLEPLQTELRVLFTPPQTRAISFLDSDYDIYRGRRKRLQQGLGGDFTYKAPRETSLAYATEVSEPVSESARRAAIAAGVDQPVARWITDRWTQLPDQFDPRIGRLARTLVGSKGSALERALKIQAALRNDWSYSLAGDQDPDDPLGDFLFGRKEGHCEYFATAMAVMMRSLGHPARVVNGYLGGQFNDFGDYRMLKQGDAHAWVEVFFPGYGWATFEPTPPSGQLAPELTGLVGWARRAADGAAMLWYSWVVEYDLERQVAMMRRVGRILRKFSGGLRIGRKKSKGLRRVEEPQQKPKEVESIDLQPWLPALLVLVLLIGAFALWRVRNRHVDLTHPRLHKLSMRLERVLARHSMQRQSWETWSAVAERLQSHDQDLGVSMYEFARDFDRARYGPPNEAATGRALHSGAALLVRLKRYRPSDKIAA